MRWLAPPEIIQQIQRYLDSSDLFCLLRINQTYRQVFQDIAFSSVITNIRFFLNIKPNVPEPSLPDVMKLFVLSLDTSHEDQARILWTPFRNPYLHAIEDLAIDLTNFPKLSSAYVLMLALRLTSLRDLSISGLRTDLSDTRKGSAPNHVKAFIFLDEVRLLCMGPGYECTTSLRSLTLTAHPEHQTNPSIWRMDLLEKVLFRSINLTSLTICHPSLLHMDLDPVLDAIQAARTAHIAFVLPTTEVVERVYRKLDYSLSQIASYIQSCRQNILRFIHSAI